MKFKPFCCIILMFFLFAVVLYFCLLFLCFCFHDITVIVLCNCMVSNFQPSVAECSNCLFHDAKLHFLYALYKSCVGLLLSRYLHVSRIIKHSFSDILVKELILVLVIFSLINYSFFSISVLTVFLVLVFIQFYINNFSFSSYLVLM